MNIKWLRYAVVILGLATLYYFLTSKLMGNMPYSVIPTWWVGIWPSRRVGVFTWFGALTATATLIAAIPVAAFVVLGIARHRIRMAFVVGALTAAAGLGELLASEFSPLRSAPEVAVFVWLDSLVHFLLFLLAVPFFVWIACALRSAMAGLMPQSRP
jgi:hypothetical protein